MRYVVWDTETGSKEVYKRTGNPRYNKLVAFGLKYPNKLVQTHYKQPYVASYYSDCDVKIGHNIKYDLLYIWGDPSFQDWLRNGGRVLDTSLLEYILTAQQHTYPALRDIAVNRYGCEAREKKMETYWEQGIDTNDIPKELVIEDVGNDVLNTEVVALQQWKKVKEFCMESLVWTNMDGLLATTEIEYNGLYVDQKVLESVKILRIKERDRIEKEIQELVKDYWPTLFKITDHNISRLLFGGALKITEKVPLINELGVHEQVKSGKNKGTFKYRNQDTIKQIIGFGLHPLKEWETLRSDIYQTNDKVLSLISKSKTIEGKFAQLVLDYRSVNKEITTYYTGFQNLIYDVDGCVHASYNHTSTETGRLSCTKPNLQNIPRADDTEESSLIKAHFTSRYGNEGVLIEADFAQLEFVIFAQLTQDPQLIKDILSGLDVHKHFASLVNNVPEEQVTPEQRQKVKRGVFLFIYGGGAAKFSREHNVSLGIAKALMKAFYDRYPIAKQWQEKQVNKVKANAKYIDKYTEKGHKVQESYYTNITGRRFRFETTDAPEFMVEKGEFTGFNPPDVKNYPVQSFAFDIVITYLGMVFRDMLHNKSNKKYLLVNTVHDSIIIDCKKAYVDECCTMLQNVIKELPGRIKELWGITMKVPLRIDIKIGANWKDMVKYKEVENV